MSDFDAGTGIQDQGLYQLVESEEPRGRQRKIEEEREQREAGKEKVVESDSPRVIRLLMNYAILIELEIKISILQLNFPKISKNNRNSPNIGKLLVVSKCR